MRLGSVFQSLRGFGVGWSGMLFAMAEQIVEFQSLRGFGVGWSTTCYASTWPPASSLCFNP